MDEWKNKPRSEDEKSSPVMKQKSLGEKLKNESNSKKFYRKKLRYGKKDTAKTAEELKKEAMIHRQGRKFARAEMAARREFYQKLSESNQDENVGAEAISSASETAGYMSQKVKADLYHRKLHKKSKKEWQDNKTHTSMETSKQLYKKKTKREMVDSYQNKREREAATSGLGRKIVDKAKDMTGRIGEFITEHVIENPKVLLVIGIVFLIVMVCMCMFSSCALIGGGVNNATIATSYTAEDEEILLTDEAYVELEEQLQEEIANIERDYPGYDEYRYNLAEVGHNPYQLAALLTVLFEDYTFAEVESTMQEIFDIQYLLAKREIVEIRTRTEERTGTRMVWDEDNMCFVEEEYIYEVEVQYEYHILEVTLVNTTMDTAVRSYGLSDDEMERYELLLLTYGNKPYLFGNDIYNVVDPGEYQDYNIPAEYLTDAEFANMIQCAQRYLGYPYVWGGSTPSTGFDCSGFVSYVINQCGNGWNVGRKSANGLLGSCDRVTASDAMPGDLIFFEGTYNTPGASHVGIYVGDGMMLHCGNPIQYTSINTPYWQDHFYTYGRIN